MKIRYTTCGQPPAKVEATYSEKDFIAMWNAEDRAALVAGQSLIAKADPDSAWPVDVKIERVS